MSVSAEEATQPAPGAYYNLADFETLAGAKIESFAQAPLFDDRVASGELPPVEERLPENPLVLKTWDTKGEYGGTLRFNSINIDQDWHLRHINAGNLIEMPASSGWDVVSTVFGVPKEPGIFESFGMNADGTVFTATIRKGLKWSDGVPVTTEDVAFRINDIYLNKDLYPATPTWLVWGDQPAKLNIADDYTFSLTFAKPYGSFIEMNVTLWPGTFQRLILPKHYLTKYHKDYADAQELQKFLEEEGYTSINEWVEFFGKKTALFGCDNTKMDVGRVTPTLNPFVITQDLGNGNYLLERNPYFHMIDQEGNQLPYIDYLRRTYVADGEMENMSIISGQVDLSCMTISIDNYPLYKQHEADGKYVAMPLMAWQDQIFITGFNSNPGVKPPQLQSIKQNAVSDSADDSMYDPGLAEVYGNVQFRRAMSVALNRTVFNDTLFLGLGREAQVAPRPATPFYKDGMEESYAKYDPDQAKAWLDEMGMVDINGDGWRERPDGKPFAMKYEYFVITGASTPGAELCKRFWEAVGVKVDLKLVDVQYWWENLQPNNLNEATTWWLAGSGAQLLQHWFLGPSMFDPLWNRYTRYKGQVSEEDWALILKYVPEWQQEMQDLREKLLEEVNEEERVKIGTRMWELQAEFLPIIGTVTDSRSPLIISADIGNVEQAEDLGYNYITVMEASEQLYFKNPERRK